jgi:hypothetical protein
MGENNPFFFPMQTGKVKLNSGAFYVKSTYLFPAAGAMMLGG